MGRLLSLSMPQSQAFYFYAAAFILPAPHSANFQDLCRISAVPGAQRHSWPQWSCSGAGFVTRDGDGLSSLPTTLPGPAEMRPFPFSLPRGWPLHISGGAHCHGEPFLGGKGLVHSSTRISMWQVLGAPLLLQSTCKGWGRLQPSGHSTLCGMGGGGELPLSRHVSWVCALISALSSLYLPVKQELEALYCFKVRNGCNEMRSPPETHLGTNFILCSYLGINFHCFLGVVE